MINMLTLEHFSDETFDRKSAILAKCWRNGKSALLLRRETKKHHETDTIILQTARRFRQLLLDASADGVF